MRRLGRAMKPTGRRRRVVEFAPLGWMLAAVETADGRVVTNWAMSAIHTSELYGLAPSGRRVRVRGVEIWRCSNGKISENWNAIDIRDLLEKARASSP